MRRLTALAGSLIVVALILIASVQCFAQRGGGHGAAGGHGGFSSHGGFSGGHAFSGHGSSGVHSGSGFSARSGRGSTFNRGLSARGFNHSGVGLRLRTYGFRNGFRSGCFGFRCGYSYGYGYPWLGIDPYWWWDSGSSYDQDQQDQIGLANEMNQQSLEEQRMRHQGDQDTYAHSSPPPHVPERTVAAPATVLIFRDQHRQEVQNYAIVGETLFNFAPQHTQKIPLSDLDLAATTKANDERGVDFRVPTIQGKLTLEYHSVDN
jgi:hypothetical protein